MNLYSDEEPIEIDEEKGLSRTMDKFQKTWNDINEKWNDLNKKDEKPLNVQDWLMLKNIIMSNGNLISNNESLNAKDDDDEPEKTCCTPSSFKKLE